MEYEGGGSRNGPNQKTTVPPLKLRNGADDSSEEDGSSDQESASSSGSGTSNQNSAESYFVLQGDTKPYPSILTQELNLELNIAYICENNHPFQNIFYSIGLKLTRSESILNSLQQYFNLKDKKFKCQDCNSQVSKCFNSIMKTPNILMLDISFFDEEGTIIKKNFEIPNTIDLALYLNPTLTEDCGTQYEVFGIVVLDTLEGG